MSEPAPRPRDLDGQRVGLVGVERGGSASFLDLLASKLERRHFIQSIVRVDWPADADASGLSDDVDDLVGRCDVVVLGVCHTAGSAGRAVAVADALEGAALPCAVVVADGLDGLDRLDAHGTAVVALSAGLAEDRPPHELVETSYRAVERVLTSGDRPSTAVEDPPPAGRNPDVRCDC